MRWLMLLALALWAAPAAAQLAHAGALMVRAQGSEVQVRLALSRPLAADPTAFALPGPPARWVVDLGPAGATRQSVPGAGGVAEARLAQLDATTVRLVLVLERPMELAGARMDGRTLELRLAPAGTLPAGATLRRTLAGVAPAPPTLPRPPPPPPPEATLDQISAAIEAAERAMAAPAAAPRLAAAARSAPRGSQRRPLVVLDPGHGGHDPGALAADGTREKDVVLAIALAARRTLERDGRVTVRLTRDDDRFLSLGRRVQLARQWGADLFVSIHADAAPNLMARGATVYTLSDVASDREAARVAAAENRADAVPGVSLAGEAPEVSSLLIDLALRDGMNRSAAFAQALQRTMEPMGIGFRTQFHRFAGFRVLRNLGVPAVLFEAGYLSNEDDARLLASSAHQRRLGEGLARAAADWLAAGPPGGVVAAQQER